MNSPTAPPSPLSALSATRTDRLTAIASAAGTFVEWFDFMLFAYLAPIMAPLFFPESDKLVAILNAYVLFGLGFAIRPLGGAVIGRFGDLYGRRKTLILSVLLMSLPMFATAALPTYATIGIWAPILLGLNRLAMGFSVGGEWSGTVVALYESGGVTGRSKAVSAGILTSGIGMMAASGLVTLFSSLLSSPQMSSWGWRLIYVIGGWLALATVALRRVMRETASFERLRSTGGISRHPIRESLQHDWPELLRIALLSGCGSLVFYVISVFIPGYLQTKGGWSERSSSMLVTVSLVITTFSPLGFGWLADRQSWKLTFFASLLALLSLTWPLFACIASGAKMGIWILYVGLALGSSAFSVMAMTLSAECFPTARRFTGLALSSNLGVLLFGGSAPAICTKLAALWGPTTPMLYLYAVIVPTAVIFVHFVRRHGSVNRDMV